MYCYKQEIYDIVAKGDVLQLRLRKVAMKKFVVILFFIMILTVLGLVFSKKTYINTMR